MVKSTLSHITYLVILALLLNACKASSNDDLKRVLVFSKTEGYRHHAAIEAGKIALQKLAKEEGLFLDTTEDASRFNDDSLRKYKAVVLLNISGAVFNEEQRISFQRFVQAGGGVLAIHASADAERDWPWYGNLIGAYFDTHPPTQQVTFRRIDSTHPATEFMPDSISRTEEMYNFQMVNPAINLLVTADEKTYTGGVMGDNHPAVWYHDYDGGRSFYTSWGHEKKAWSEPLYLRQISTALQWVMRSDNLKPLNYNKSIPEQNRFIRHELISAMDEPIQMAILKNGNVFIAQRRGSILLFEAEKGTSRNIGTIPVLSAYEDGLLGIAADPNFEKNGFIYVFYAEPGAKDSVSDYRISRFNITENILDLKSEKILIQIPHQNADGIHTGGGMMFDPRGNGDLFITVGDNTSPRATLYAPLDERPGRELFNAQRTSANTNDLRGKILRIHPEPSGSYTIPKGNLFPVGTANTRPEIYSMGHRQPWRLSMDTKTGWLYEGEVGPDAPTDSVNRGPMAYDEFNQIRKPGNFGWPYFGGNNRAYYETDFETGITGREFDKAKPVNNSRLNTGLKELPPAQGSLIWYSNSISKEFPIMGRGARSAMGGPIYRKSDYKNSSAAFPEYYEGKWFITEWIRDWIIVVTLDEEGQYKSMERFLPELEVAGPMDLQFGPDGSLYILEYGKGWFRQNNDSKLVRIEFNAGNRKPVAIISANRVTGSVPFDVDFTSQGSKDYDGDDLSYQWIIESKDGDRRTFDEPNPKVSFSKKGVYTATLVVTDSQGSASSATLEVTSGNESPEVKLNILKGNRSFFFADEKIEYEVLLSDKEDGSLKDGGISMDAVTVSMNYSAEGFNPTKIGGPTAEQRGIGIKGGMIINSNDCYHCHSISLKSVGPTFLEIAEKYKGDKRAEESLAKKVIDGGGGVWGTVSMSAHPDLPLEDSKKMIQFILNLAQAPPASLPVKGTHQICLPARFAPRGVYVLHAGYKDRGANGMPGVSGEDAVVLRPPWMLPSQANRRMGGMNVKVPNPRGEIEILQKEGAYIAYTSIDLKGISAVEIHGEGGGQLEVRIDSHPFFG